MEKIKVYTCGPMTGLTIEAATVWREYVEKELGEDFIILSPMRVEGTYLKKEKTIGALPKTTEPVLQGPAIYHRDIFDIERSDILLCNLNDAPEGPCIGSIFELGYAAALRPQPAIIVVARKDTVFARHPLITTPASIIFEELEPAVEHIKLNFGVFNGY